MCLFRLGIVGTCSVVKFGRPSKVSLHLICFCHSVYKRGSVLLFNNTGVGGTAWKQEKKELRSHEPGSSVARSPHMRMMSRVTRRATGRTRACHTHSDTPSPCPRRAPLGLALRGPTALSRLYLCRVCSHSNVPVYKDLVFGERRSAARNRRENGRHVRAHARRIRRRPSYPLLYTVQYATR